MPTRAIGHKGKRMNKILIILENMKSAQRLLEKARAFKPEQIDVLCCDKESFVFSENLISDAQAKGYSIEVHHIDGQNAKEKESRIVSFLEQAESNLIILSRQWYEGEAPDFALIKAVLKQATHSKVLLCGDKKWSEPLKVLGTIDILDDSAAHSKLNMKVQATVDELSELMAIESHALSIIPISQLGQDLVIVEPSEVLTEKGEATMTKLEAFTSNSPSELSCTAHVAAGTPSKEIPAVAKKLKTDLVVMGNVGRKGLQGFFIGNTAERILTHLSVDALIVKA